MTKKKTIAYVEFGHTGHRAIWIRNVLHAFEKLHSGWQLNVWVPQEFVKAQEEWCAPYLKSSSPSDGGITFRFLEEVIGSGGIHGQIVPGSFEIVRRCIEADGADVCFLANNLDACVKDIALSRPNASRAKLVGVLDQPFLHYAKFSSARTKKWLTPRRYLSAYVKNLLMCHRSAIAEVLMLDPLAPEFYNTILKTSKFRFLPESFVAGNPFQYSRKHFGLPEDKSILLFIGSIDRRKGTREFLEALQKAFSESFRFRQQVAVVFAGSVMPEVYNMVYTAVSDFRASYLDTPVFLFDRFVTDREFLTFIYASDVVCIPYVNLATTSGVLMNAAAYGRPVLASDFGIVGELVRRYNLGITCNESDPAELADALCRSVEEAQRMDEGRRREIKAFASRYSVSLEQFGEEICASLVRAVVRE